MKNWLCLSAVIVLSIGKARADFPLPATADSQQAAPAVVTLNPNSSVNDVLDALDARGKNLQDFVADVTLSNSDNATGDTVADIGKITLQRLSNDDARIRVAFSKRQKGTGKMIVVDHQYTIDKGVLVDRDYQAKKEIRRQILKPGQKLDLFKLGQGPFPLPLGQDKADVLKMFDVQKIAPAAGDPANTVHLQLTPKAGTSFANDFATIDLWVDQKTDMPTRIQTVDANNTATRTTDLANIQLNTGVGDKEFVQPPLPPGSDTIDEPYRG